MLKNVSISLKRAGRFSSSLFYDSLQGYIGRVTMYICLYIMYICFYKSR